ncbi:MAG: nitrile hydratase subunit alpha, partial [Roseovarius indicus]
TLCSCYPLGILGMSPSWYKSTEYRARAVRDPRGVLAEFGTVLPEGVELKVWDSTSDRRYMVVPERPAGTEGWSEEALAGLVTRNSMIGTVRDLSPARGAA